MLLNDLDGADTDNGLPDGNHIDNANMSTPPDGIPPTMRMYLLSHAPGARAAPSAAASYAPAPGALEPDVILGHDYTHGLSNRLVVDPPRRPPSTLNSIQAGAMARASRAFCWRSTTWSPRAC